MASNVSREKLLFYAAAGALGGFAAWGLSEPILGIRWVYGRDALIGALISAFLASIETLSVGQVRQAIRRFVVGGLVGAVGGALGLIVGELAFDVIGGFNGRILGWGVLGIAVGLGGAPAQWRNWWRARRRARRIFLPEPDDHFSAGVRPCDRDHSSWR